MVSFIRDGAKEHTGISVILTSILTCCLNSPILISGVHPELVVQSASSTYRQRRGEGVQQCTGI